MPRDADPPPQARRTDVSTVRPAIAAGAAIVIAAIALWTWAYRTQFDGLWYPDAFDYAQLGRQIHAGEGFTSLQTFPYVLAWLDARGVETDWPWPNVTRFVLPTLLKAAAYGVVGVGDLGAVLPGAVFYVVGAVLVFLLGRRLHSTLAGVLSATVLLLSPSHLHYSISGMTEPGAGFLLVCAVLFLLSAVESPRRAVWHSLALGALLGLIYLHRSNLVLLAPIGCVWLLVRHGPRRGVTCCLALGLAGLLVNLPWMIRNATLFGSPFVSLTMERYFLMSFLDANPFDELRQYSLGEVFRDNLHRYPGWWLEGYFLKDWRAMFGVELAWLGPAFVLSVLVPGAGRARKLWIVTAALVALHLVILSTPYTVRRIYQPFVVLLIPQVLAAGLRLAARWPERQVVLRALVTVAALALALTAFGRRAGSIAGHMDEGWPTIRRAIQATVPPDGCIASDYSWAISWSAERPSVRFKGDPAQLAILHRDLVSIDAVFLSGKRADAFRDAAAPEFRVARRWPGGSTLWLRAR